MGRAEILRSYREALRLIGRLPAGKQPAALEEARASMRKHVGETNEDKIGELHKVLMGKIGWLRMTTPRRPGESRGSGHYVLRDGELVEGAGWNFQGKRAADGTTDINTARKMNDDLIKRQFFGKMPPRSSLEVGSRF